jgi:TetR/AcrR family transcriptional regulator, regulator of cefoperazone and chloramphenicol sensitivity
MNRQKNSTSETRQRLLVAAGEVFAEQGFHNTTVRDICRQAGVNIAAVNYYFHSKEELYEAVCNYSLDLSINKYPPTLGITEDASPQERLHTFIRSFLFSMLEKGEPSWHEKLVTREMNNPTGTLDNMVETTIKPRNKIISAIVRDFLGSAAPDDVIRQCCLSIIGQCLHYHYAQQVIQRLYPKQKFDAAGIEAIAAHITSFSLYALQQFRHALKKGDKA